MERNTAIRAANELSLAAWFGGSLMGVAGIERGAAAANGDRHRVESAAWAAWRPLQTVAILTQVASGAALTVANRQRVLGQRGVAAASVVRTGLLGTAIALTVAAAATGSRLGAARESGADGGDGVAAPDERTLRVLQWSVSACTGALLVMDALMGEQQRPGPVLRGGLDRLLPDALRAV